MKSERGYFTRLKDHPGLGMGVILTIIGTFAGASNQSFDNMWYGALFGGLIMGSFVWGIILLSNFDRD
jgi:hypothetical protein